MDVNVLEHSSPWVDDKGNNTPAYNHKYWVEHKDEILQKRKVRAGGLGTRPRQIGKLGDPAKDRKKAEKAAKEASAKEKTPSAKEKSSSSKSSSTGSSSSKSNETETVQQVQAESDESKKLKMFTKLKMDGYEDVYDNPYHNFDEFVKQMKEQNDVEVKNDEAGVALWKEFKKSLGDDDDDTIVGGEFRRSSTSTTDEDEEKKLKHGLDLYESLMHGLEDDYYDEDYLEHHGRLHQKWGVQNGPPYPLSSGQLTSAYKNSGGLSDSAREVYGNASEVIKKAASTVAKGASDVGKSLKKKTAEIKAANEKKKAEKAKKIQEAKDVISKSDLTDAEKKSLEYKRSVNMSVKDSGDPIAVKKMVNEYQERKATEAAKKSATKEDAIARGDANYAREHFTELSDEDIRKILTRVDLNKSIDKALGVKTDNNQNNGQNNNNGGQQKKDWKDQDVFEKLDTVGKRVETVKNFADKGINAWNTMAKVYNSISDKPLPTIDDKTFASKLAKASSQQMVKDVFTGKTTMEDFVKNASVDTVLQGKEYAEAVGKITGNLKALKAVSNTVISDTKPDAGGKQETKQETKPDTKPSGKEKTKDKTKDKTDSKTKEETKPESKSETTSESKEKSATERLKDQIAEPAKKYKITPSSSFDYSNYSDLNKRILTATEDLRPLVKDFDEIVRISSEAIDNMYLDELRKSGNK